MLEDIMLAFVRQMPQSILLYHDDYDNAPFHSDLTVIKFLMDTEVGRMT